MTEFTHMEHIETALVSILFILYSGLWNFKRVIQRKQTGIDPEVIGQSKSHLQIFMGVMFGIIRIFVIVLIVLHSLKLRDFSILLPYEGLSSLQWDFLGFSVGLIGLSFCLYAQLKMKNSWRVGIDEGSSEDLVTDGLYRWIRNPTYLGLFILNFGVWLIWPTYLVSYLNIIFFFLLEVQVRCEEDFLEGKYGTEYLNYRKNTYRYIPFIY